MSIVDTKTNEIVGDMLKVWSEGYAPGKKESDVPEDQKVFSVTVPEGLETRCATAGACVSSPPFSSPQPLPPVDIYEISY